MLSFSYHADDSNFNFWIEIFDEQIEEVLLRSRRRDCCLSRILPMILIPGLGHYMSKFWKSSFRAWFIMRGYLPFFRASTILQGHISFESFCLIVPRKDGSMSTIADNSDTPQKWY